MDIEKAMKKIKEVIKTSLQCVENLEEGIKCLENNIEIAQESNNNTCNAKELEEEYKYCLIVSQYYNSYIMHLVKITENFREEAVKCAKEIVEHKRAGETIIRNGKKDYIGDLEYIRKDDILRYRYNINDVGDLYFINYKYANAALGDCEQYFEKARNKGYVRKSMQERIDTIHKDIDIYNIIKRHFEIA